MTLPGGPADKLGNRFEGLWTLLSLVDVLRGEGRSIRLEPPREDGFEFWLDKADRREFHQAKRQNGSKGWWSLSDLDRAGVLSDFWTKLQHPDTVCVFVSRDRATELEELKEAAQGAASVEEFRRAFLATPSRSAAFDRLRRIWQSGTEEDILHALRRVTVEAGNETLLRHAVEGRLVALVRGDPATVADILAEYVVENVYQTLTAEKIWHHIEERGFRPADIASDTLVVAAVRAANDNYLRGLRRELIGGELLPRSEADAAVDRLTAPQGKQGVLLSGAAGAGKSGVVLQVVETLAARGWLVLPIRADRLDPDSTVRDVGQKLNLPTSPVHVLGAMARGADCLLVIDQLDAVSSTSGRAMQLFDTIDELMSEAGTHPGMRVLLACRRFDLENDDRLRKLADERGVVEVVPVDRLSEDAVREVVSRLGFDATNLASRQLALLSLPLHLRLLEQVAETGDRDLTRFQTANDLFSRFWQEKELRVSQRLGRDAHWTDVIDTMCDYISERQTALQVTAPRLDRWRRDAEAMVSEHVLTRDGNHYAFFHESFFDYAYARRFVGRGTDLLPFLRAGEQHLFRRAQVRQILLHQRDSDPSRYQADLNALLTNPDIRFHLKDVVFALLSDLSNPTPREWRVLEPLVRDPTYPHRRHIWFVLDRSVGWMLLLDQLGVLERWVSDPDADHVDLSVALLSSMERYRPDRVAELAEPFVGEMAWNRRFVRLVTRSDLTGGRRFLELVLRLIDEGVLDDARGLGAVNTDFWDLLYEQHQRRPAWASELIGHWLKRRFEIARNDGRANPFEGTPPALPDSQLAPLILSACASVTPAEFALAVLPFILEVVAANVAPDSGPLVEDSVWRYRFYGDRFSLDDVLLEATATALGALAANQPDVFASLSQLLRSSLSETIQYLLVRAYTAGGARLADEAAEHLCNAPGCLGLGYANGSYWAARRLLEAITPHCAAELLARLEEAVLDFYPDREKGEAHRYQGRAQLTLIEGIDPSRRSERANRRLAEWKRKFGQSVEPPRPVEVGWGVESPIPETAAERMADEHWLQAIAKYDRDRMAADRRGVPVGGVHELARMLKSQVRQEPVRFAQLVQRFPDDAHPSYFEAVLDGLAEADTDTETLLPVWHRVHRLPGRPCGTALCNMITKFAERPLPMDMLDTVAWYATEDPGPARETWPGSVKQDRPRGQEILTQGLNCVRGRAAEALFHLIWHDGDRVAHLRPVLDKMVRDPSLAVRSRVAATLLAVLRHDRETAVGLFLELCDADGILLTTRDAEQFLRYALPTHFARLAPLLDETMESPQDDVAMVAARQSTLASLTVEEALPLAERARAGRPPHRRGAAEVYASNVSEERFSDVCGAPLVQLFLDSEEEVRTAASGCFRHFAGASLVPGADLVGGFAESPAFDEHHGDLLMALDRATGRLPEETVRACEKFLELVGADAGDLSTRSAADARTASHLLMRIYSQTDQADAKARALDLIDGMAGARAYGIKDVLEAFER